MDTRKLDDNELGDVAGGQIGIDDVMGVEGLSVSTGAPTNKNPEGVFWRYHGISLTKKEAMDVLKKKATRCLDEGYTNEAFLAGYIRKYNDEIDGEMIED